MRLNHKVMENKKKVLVVGAGPVGLAAALFMTENPHVIVKVVDNMKGERDFKASRALLVNPRSLAILEGFKSQKQIIEQGRNMK